MHCGLGSSCNFPQHSRVPAQASGNQGCPAGQRRFPGPGSCGPGTLTLTQLRHLGPHGSRAPALHRHSRAQRILSRGTQCPLWSPYRGRQMERAQTHLDKWTSSGDDSRNGTGSGSQQDIHPQGRCWRTAGRGREARHPRRGPAWAKMGGWRGGGPLGEPPRAQPGRWAQRARGIAGMIFSHSKSGQGKVGSEAHRTRPHPQSTPHRWASPPGKWHHGISRIEADTS